MVDFIAAPGCPTCRAEPTVWVSLSGRQRQIVHRLAQGLTYEQISRDLHISLSTVKTHGVAAFQGLGAVNARHAVALAYEQGVLRPGDVKAMK